MDDEINLPFKEGQLTELKSFLEGFRGAWFKCKIKNMSRKKGRLGCVLEYLDFPDEKLQWTKLYQVTCHHEGNTKGKHRELMLRPAYPPIYNEKKMPRDSEISEVAVIVGDSWRKGDLVDWWTNDCYWSGRIEKILGPNNAEIELRPPPLGEGSSYPALFKDLRPSLDWSPERGWTVPTQEGAGRPCARLIKSLNRGREAEVVQRSTGSFFTSPAPSGPAVSGEKIRTAEPQTQTVSEKRKDKQERNASQGPVEGSKRKKSRVVADSLQNRDEVKSRTAETQTQIIAKKQKDKLETNASEGRKTRGVVVDSVQKGAEVKGRKIETQMQTVSEIVKEKQEGNASQGPVDSSKRKSSAVTCPRQSGAEMKGRTMEMEMQTVTGKRKDQEKRNAQEGPADSIVRKTSKVVADSRQNGAVVKRRTTETVPERQKDKQELRTSQGPVDGSSRKTSLVVADSGEIGAEVKSRTTETQRQTVAKKCQDQQEKNACEGHVDIVTRKERRLVADFGQNIAEMKSKTETQTQTISERLKDRRGMRTIQGGSSRKTNLVAADCGQSGAKVKSITTKTHTQAKKLQDQQEKNACEGPAQSNIRNTSQVVAVSSRVTEMQTCSETYSTEKTVSMKRKDRNERITSQAIDSHSRKSSRISDDSEQNAAVPAAEVAELELNPDSSQKKYRPILNLQRSDTAEAAIMDLEEYLNKVKWLKKILQNGISSSEGERPQWTVL